MKLLIVHNDYGRHSGEESVVERMEADMRADGVEVETLRRSSKFFRESVLARAKAFLAGVHSGEGVAMMREALRTFRPDVVNVHNLYPFISPAALKECRKAGVPVVMTVHNYRLVCPTGLFLRQGKPCEECLLRHHEMPCLLHNCEGSLPRSLAYALRNAVARIGRYYLNNVNRYVCLTQFQQQKLVAFGYPKERMVVIPNYVEACAEPMQERHGNYVAYAGRASHEKGYDLLLEVARRHPETEFRLAGGGFGEGAAHSHNVVFCGNLSGAALDDFYRQAAFVAIPSRCYEGLPMTLLEAMAHGKACIVPAHGAFPDLIGMGDTPCGLTFAPGDVDALETAILTLRDDSDLMARLGHNARQAARTRFSRQAVMSQWHTLLSQVAAKA